MLRYGLDDFQLNPPTGLCLALGNQPSSPLSEVIALIAVGYGGWTGHAPAPVVGKMAKVGKLLLKPKARARRG